LPNWIVVKRTKNKMIATNVGFFEIKARYILLYNYNKII
jgi:hypothetical protein